MATTKQIITLVIPSRSNPGPILSIGGDADVTAWRNPDYYDIPAYITEVVRGLDHYPRTQEQYLDLFEKVKRGALPSFRHTPSWDGLINEIVENRETFLERDSPWLRWNVIEQLLSHPVSPRTSITEAIDLTERRSLPEIQAYLNDLGVTSFTAESVINLPSPLLFFFLTRLYGPPTAAENLEIASQIRGYSQRATNEEARHVAYEAEINDQYYYLKAAPVFGAFFERILENPDDPEIWQAAGARTKERFLENPLFYMALVQRSTQLPPLSLQLLLQLNHNLPSGVFTQRGDVLDLLANYTDGEIEALFGQFNADTRSSLEGQVYNLLTRDNFLIMFPSEASICSDQVPDDVFIGVGSLATGYDCLTFEQLFTSLRTDTWSRRDLNNLKETLIRGRDPIEIPDAMIDEVHAMIQA